MIINGAKLPNKLNSLRHKLRSFRGQVEEFIYACILEIICYL